MFFRLFITFLAVFAVGAFTSGLLGYFYFYRPLARAKADAVNWQRRFEGLQAAYEALERGRMGGRA
jgi:hypothetical protein